METIECVVEACENILQLDYGAPGDKKFDGHLSVVSCSSADVTLEQLEYWNKAEQADRSNTGTSSFVSLDTESPRDLPEEALIPKPSGAESKCQCSARVVCKYCNGGICEVRL